MRIASFSFVWRPWEAKPEIWAADGTPIECTTDEHSVPIVRRTKAPLKAAPVVESAAAGSADTFRISDGADAQPSEGGAEAVRGSGVAADDLVSSVGFIREVGDSADCRELLKDIERVVHDDDDAGSAEAHDNVAGSAKFTLKKDGAEFEDEEYCTLYAGPQSVEHQALHLPRVRGCFGCDHGKALHPYKRRSKGATLGLTGPDVALKPFGALVHIDWLEMKNGSRAHGIVARALLITDQETEFLGVQPSKHKLASEVVRALHDFGDPGSPAIRRLLSDRALEYLSAVRTLRSSRPFAHFVTVPYRHASEAERTNRTAVESTRASLLQAGFPDTWWAVCMIYFVAMWNGHMRGRDWFTPYQRRHGEDATYRMYPWGSLVFAHLHKLAVVEDEDESDRWRSKLTPCIFFFVERIAEAS